MKTKGDSNEKMGIPEKQKIIIEEREGIIWLYDLNYLRVIYATILCYKQIISILKEVLGDVHAELSKSSLIKLLLS